MKDSKRNIINLIFSSFLIIGYIICTYFFTLLAKQVPGSSGVWIQIAITLIFGLLLFYATRVGEGRQIWRFSIPVLVLVDFPCIYIIAAAMIDGLPFHAQLAAKDGVLPIILMLAAIALGYGIPYTFVSGYELNTGEEEPEEEEKKEEVLKGGLAEELEEVDMDAEVDDTEDETADDAAEE